MKFLTVAGALMMSGSLSVVSAAHDGMTQCPRSIELLLVQDASSSFVDFADVMADSVKELIHTMDREIGKVKTSLAIFSDKPVPYRGNGQGRGYVGVLDVCYSNRDTYPLGNDPKQIEQGFRAIKARRCEGGDYPEDPFEAMIYGALDPKVNWTNFDDDEDVDTFTDDRGVTRRIKHDAEGNTIVKLMVVVTDDHPHYEGEAYDGIYNWNPLPEGESDGFPRFMDEDFLDVGLIYDSEAATNAYHELLKLHKDPKQIDTAHYHQLLEFVGPAFYPTPLVHPGTFEANEDCRQYEYPNLETVGRVLNKEQILPILLLTPPQDKTNTFIHRCKKRGFQITKESSDDEWMDCLKFVYTDDLKKAGFHSFIVGRFTKNRQDLIDQVVKLVDDLSMDYTCPELTTAKPVTSTTSRSTTSLTEDESTIPVVPVPPFTGQSGTTVPEGESTGDATPANGSTRPRTSKSTAKHTSGSGVTDDVDTTTLSVDVTTNQIYTRTSTEVSESTDDIYTKSKTGGGKPTSDTKSTRPHVSRETTETNEGDSTEDYTTGTDDESSSHTTHIPVVPPVIPEASSGSSTGTIAGATGGAVAGTAALAGVLYKKFGASLLGHSGPSDLGAVEQVEVPETQVEREAFEEVTMDMFQ